MGRSALVKRYRVWYRLNKLEHAMSIKAYEEVEATSCANAKKIVEEKYPGCKATSAWLIEK